jgi:enoyl-CoA hydratase
VNQVYDNMGLQSTQYLGPVLDGYMRNTPEAHEFIDVAAKAGVGEAVRRRDGPFDDYSQGPPERRPRREHVIDPKANGGT